MLIVFRGSEDGYSFFKINSRKCFFEKKKRKELGFLRPTVKFSTNHGTLIGRRVHVS